MKKIILFLILPVLILNSSKSNIRRDILNCLKPCNKSWKKCASTVQKKYQNLINQCMKYSNNKTKYKQCSEQVTKTIKHELKKCIVQYKTCQELCKPLDTKKIRNTICIKQCKESKEKCQKSIKKIKRKCRKIFNKCVEQARRDKIKNEKSVTQCKSKFYACWAAADKDIRNREARLKKCKKEYTACSKIPIQNIRQDIKIISQCRNEYYSCQKLERSEKKERSNKLCQCKKNFNECKNVCQIAKSLGFAREEDDDKEKQE